MTGKTSKRNRVVSSLTRRRFPLLAFLCLMACSTGQQAPQQPAVPVAVAKVVQKDVPVEITTIGRVDPYSTVSVRSQISAEVKDVCFKEGQDVKKGFCLFKLDCRTYEAALLQAEANLTRDIAQAKNADEDLKRYTPLVEEQYVTREQYEKIRTNAEVTKATVKADRAIVENSRVQIQYCNIYSPVEGRTGSIKVNRGISSRPMTSRWSLSTRSIPFT